MTIMKQNTPSGRRNSPAVVFYLFFAAVPLVLLFPSLNKDWALLDDPDMMTYSIRGVDAILENFDFTELYSPANRASSRFHPGFYFYKGILAKIIGLNPFINHIWQMLLLYIHLAVMHIIIFRLTRSYLSSALGICLYLFYAQGGWSTSYYNWYSLMTYEPWLLPVFLTSMFAFHFSNRLAETKKRLAWVLLGFSVLILGYADFTKEICFAFSGVTFTVFLLTLSRRFNPFEWKKKYAGIWFGGSLFFAILFLGVYKILKSGGGGGGPENYNMSLSHIISQLPDLFFLLFQNYTFLVLIFPAAFLLRMIVMFREKRNPGKIEITQFVFLVFGGIWLGMLLPWEIMLERLLLISVWCFGLFAALEFYAWKEFLFTGEKRLQKAPRNITVPFFCGLFLLIAYFVFGRLVLSLKNYALLLKILTAAFGIFIVIDVLVSSLRHGKIHRLIFGFISLVSALSFLLFLFIGSFGAYNFNHKYEGIEGVLVRMVRKAAKDAKPGADIYFHLPEGHMYIGEMNFRLPLFENRPDLEAHAFSAKPGEVYHRGDYIIHHPWMSSPKGFRFFEYEGKIKTLERIHIKHPTIHGATYTHLKRWIIAHLSFPRDPRLKLLEKKYHQNWWEPYLVLSEPLVILP